MKSQPLSSPEFAKLMVTFAPFESEPVIAVGVSGGVDSMALVMLMDRWARDQGGRAIGLTLNHGLRANSAQEAVQVGHWLNQVGIEHHILTWAGKKPTSAIQDTARTVRREMLLAWCRDAGVVHLALAHHADDQAETYVMRLAHSSGPDGLAGMATVAETHHARILRPLLGVPKERLIATMSATGHSWIDDPSNEQDRFERVRVRHALTALKHAGAGREEILSAVSAYAMQRNEMDALTAEVVMRSVRFYASGYAMMDFRHMSDCSDVLGLRVLARVLCSVGGKTYAPARDSLSRLYNRLQSVVSSQSFTLGGCRLIGKNGSYLVCRELRNLPDYLPVTAAGPVKWDNRFQLQMAVRDGQEVDRDLSIRPLGRKGWRELVTKMPDIRRCNMPEPVRYALPTLYHKNAIMQVAHLTALDPKAHPCNTKMIKAAFLPPEPVAGAGFPLA